MYVKQTVFLDDSHEKKNKGAQRSTLCFGSFDNVLEIHAPPD